MNPNSRLREVLAQMVAQAASNARDVTFQHEDIAPMAERMAAFYERDVILASFPDNPMDFVSDADKRELAEGAARDQAKRRHAEVEHGGDPVG